MKIREKKIEKQCNLLPDTESVNPLIMAFHGFRLEYISIVYDLSDLWHFVFTVG